jgi:hypothetical protein
VEETIYTICAVAGGVLVLLQVVLQSLGMSAEADFDAGGGDVDMDAHTDVDGAEADGHGNLFFGVLSFKALCAFAAIFGLTGLIMVSRSDDVIVRAGVALAAGVAGMFGVAMLMRGLARLQSSGTIRIANAIGKTGSCYLRIPGHGKGRGKVTIEIQERSLQFDARTEGEEIATGARIRVLAVDGDDTLTVARN